MTELKPGDRVQVADPALATMRAIMRRSGHEPKPNHHGVIAEDWGDDGYLIHFDDGSGAPYPAQMVSPLSADDD